MQDEWPRGVSQLYLFSFPENDLAASAGERGKVNWQLATIGNLSATIKAFLSKLLLVVGNKDFMSNI